MVSHPKYNYVVIRPKNVFEIPEDNDERMTELQRALKGLCRDSPLAGDMEVHLASDTDPSFVKISLAEQLEWWIQHPLNKNQPKTWKDGMQEAANLLRSNPQGQ